MIVQVASIRGDVERGDNTVQVAGIVGHTVQVTRIRGHEISNSPPRNKMYKNDFFTLATMDRKTMYGIRNGSPNKWMFNTCEEVDNFLDYIESNTARFFLSLVKIDQHVSTGQLNYIPAVDFTRKWTEEELYIHFNFTQELIDYIEEFLNG